MAGVTGAVGRAAAARPWRRACLCLLLLAAPARAGDWPQFRGPGGLGVADEQAVPTRWGPAENVRWKAELPGRGLSSPVVARGRVYVTACTGVLQDRLHVLCFDAASGRKEWERQFWATGNTLCHPKTNMAAPTPATDGERVCALFATGDLVCLDTEGNLLWCRALARDYPGITNQVGMAASPVLWQDVLLLALETSGDSFAAGLDKYTGRNRWKVRRPREVNWVTPLLWEREGRAEALFLSAGELTAYDPRTGRPSWEYTGAGLSPTPSVPSPTVSAGLVVTGGGFAVRPGAGGAKPALAWKSSALRPSYPSPLSYQGRLYALNNTSILLGCFDPADGKVLWKQRVRGPFSASPVAAGGKVYLVNEEGVATVLQAGDRPRVLGVNRLEEPTLATPAVAGGALFLRSDRHLYCITEGNADKQSQAGRASPPDGP